MKKQSPVLTDDKTLEKVTSSFERNIPIDTQGTCDQRTIFEILIRAASAEDSIENTSKTLQNAPCGNNIRYHLEKYDDMETLESRLGKICHITFETNSCNSGHANGGDRERNFFEDHNSLQSLQFVL